MTLAQWHAATRPKITGAWNLHAALLAVPLDFFFLASSAVTTTHQPGQGNYCAANTALEALCMYRRGLGLPASAVAICPVRGVGFVAGSEAARRNMRAQGICGVSEGVLLDFLEHAVLEGRGRPGREEETGGTATAGGRGAWRCEGLVVMGLRSEMGLSDARNPTNWRRDRRMGSYHNARKTSRPAPASESKLQAFLASAAQNPAVLRSEEGAVFIAGEIGRTVQSIMLREGGVDVGESLAALGVDSLVATEVGRWVWRVFGVRVSVLEVLGGSLLEFGRAVGEGMAAGMGGE